MLTDKALLHFENWLKKQPFANFNKYTKKIIIYNKVYNDLNELFKNALIIEFFDSVGIYGTFMAVNYSGLIFEYNIQEKNTLNGMNGFTFDTREDSIKAFIKEANKIYNLKQNSNSQQH